MKEKKWWLICVTYRILLFFLSISAMVKKEIERIAGVWKEERIERDERKDKKR